SAAAHPASASSNPAGSRTSAFNSASITPASVHTVALGAAAQRLGTSCGTCGGACRQGHERVRGAPSRPPRLLRTNSGCGSFGGGPGARYSQRRSKCWYSRAGPEAAQVQPTSADVHVPTHRPAATPALPVEKPDPLDVQVGDVDGGEFGREA